MKFGFSRTRRAFLVATATGALMTATPLVSSAGAATAPAPTVTAKGAFVLDSSTGATKFSKAADTKRPMASTTKIMTAYVVLTTSGLDLNRRVTVQQAHKDYVTKNPYSSAYLRVGDKVRVGDLLDGMLAPSGCDAAYALADTFGKGTTRAERTKNFIAQMNTKAKALGLANTKFDSFDGNSPNSSANNYTTPRDLAKLAREAMKNSTFRAIVQSTGVGGTAIDPQGKPYTYSWANSNRLLGSYSGANGIKTGTNTPAGPCLVFSATRDGKSVIGVVLGASTVDTRYTDAKKMLDYTLPPLKTGMRSGEFKLRELPAGANQD
ncbi:D-alanyl-D-alanine carboxypeptidase family protein [Streptomyces sp. NPDC048603]|uniref:D-alanyl-D-alanine carboxypeptidase family protein n=1 Tax=Streptomyces sp. NPDC048603 TaxID=3365577 RepID=UPI003719B8E4